MTIAPMDQAQHTLTSYPEALRFLYGRQLFGMKFGLGGIRGLMRSHGNPEKRIRAIHVAGTNGKGSTASMIAAVLTASGQKTGLYTSPHLVDFRERIRIDGAAISRKDVIGLAERLRPDVVRNGSTFFETVTAMAFIYFAESKVDVAVIEVGLGGRLDATNVLRPLVTVITTIGLEHTKLLGRSLSAVAREKAGIVKRGVPCVTGVADTRPFEVIRAICSNRGSRLRTLSEAEGWIRSSDLHGLILDAVIGGHRLKGLRVSLAGEHQIHNVLLCLLTLDELKRFSHLCISEDAIRRGLRSIRKWTGLTGRMAVVRRKPLVVADVAHNPDGLRALVRSLKRIRPGKWRVVFGVMGDKNYRVMVRVLSAIASEAFPVEAQTTRSRSGNDVRNEFRRLAIRSRSAMTVEDGVRKTLSQRASGSPVLITGSHFVVGEALACLQGRKYLTISQ
jgi:dihydrofolate synthase/folylpolyglutamate synthase